MRILGVDPGLANTGFGVIDHDKQSSRLVTCGNIVTAADEELPQRLKRIHDELAEVIRATQPELAVMEQLFFCTNVKTAISVAQGRGVAILATAASGIPLTEYTPLQVKQGVVGYGKATKQQVELMVRKLLGLTERVNTSHAADALALALCHAHSTGFKRLVEKALGR